MHIGPSAHADVQIYVYALLSPAGRKDALKKGLPPDERVEFTLTPDDALWHRAVELDPEFAPFGGELPINRPRRYKVQHPEPEWREGIKVWRRPVVTTHFGPPIPIDEILSLEELLDLEASHARRLVATLKERGLDDLDAKWRAWLKEFVTETPKKLPESNFLFGPEYPLGERFKELCSSIDVEHPSDAEIEELLNAATAARGEAVRERLEEEDRESKKAFLEEAQRWIEEFGSGRLRKIVDAGLLETSLNVYREERLAQEHPGWKILSQRVDAQLQDTVNPPEFAVDALLDARKWDSRARLRYSSGDGVDQGPVVTANFLDRQIITFLYDEEPF